MYKYIYFNGMNMALKTTMHEGRPTALSREVMRLLAELHDEMTRYEADERPGGRQRVAGYAAHRRRTCACQGSAAAVDRGVHQEH